MELIFRKAEIRDAEPVFDFVQNAVSVMASQKIFQWDEIYPTYEDFKLDIKNGEAFVAEAAEKNGFEGRKKIAAVYALNKEVDEAYKTGNWQYAGDDYVVIHRFCVNPEFQHNGIARRFFAMIFRAE